MWPKAVALADKLETVVGIYGIGLIPTGDKDPFWPAPPRAGHSAHGAGAAAGYHRAAAGADRRRLPGRQAVRHRGRRCVWLVQGTAENLLLADARADEIDAVLALAPTRLDNVRAVLAAVATCAPAGSRHHRRQQAGENILKKVEGEVSGRSTGPAGPKPPDRRWPGHHQRARRVDAARAAGDLTGALTCLAALKARWTPLTA